VEIVSPIVSTPALLICVDDDDVDEVDDDDDDDDDEFDPEEQAARNTIESAAMAANGLADRLLHHTSTLMRPFLGLVTGRSSRA
jgi:hypothetical protein